MAHGDRASDSIGHTLYLLLDAAGGLTDGVWVDCEEFTSGIVTLELGGSTIEIDASNALARPTNATHGVALAASGAINGVLSIPVLPRWIKARVTTFVGAASVGVLLRRAY
jgi:hypothetical protein